MDAARSDLVKDVGHEADKGERGSFSDLWARKLWHTTILLWCEYSPLFRCAVTTGWSLRPDSFRCFRRRILWFSQSFVFYGLIYVLPLIFGSEEGANPYADLMLSALAEVPAIIMCAAVIDRPWCGRRRMLWGCMFGVTVCTGVGSLLDPEHPVFNLSAFGAKFFISTSFAAIYPTTMEIYPTSCRSTGEWPSPAAAAGATPNVYVTHCSFLLQGWATAAQPAVLAASSPR